MLKRSASAPTKTKRAKKTRSAPIKPTKETTPSEYEPSSPEYEPTTPKNLAAGEYVHVTVQEHIANSFNANWSQDVTKQYLMPIQKVPENICKITGVGTKRFCSAGADVSGDKFKDPKYASKPDERTLATWLDKAIDSGDMFWLASSPDCAEDDVTERMNLCQNANVVSCLYLHLYS